jgi:predicted nucleic acid-binding protein
MSPRPLVIDASALVEVLRGSERGQRVAETMRGASLAAPAHLDAEVLSAIGRLVRAVTLSDAMVERALKQLLRLPIERYPLPSLLRRAWALRDNIALRDGLYVACAEAIGAELLTLDARLARSAPVRVQLAR